ncbi:MAG: precorrin-3B C(17)-methyltransferase [Desulfosporosinus sp.]|nr:precorrin-3B C(17)-methyltransferase [Desulfosporosinus sp.]MBC2727260.1 precorrin-3B C(17)-methyltransferase [Desulfosporosinus sp.]
MGLGPGDQDHMTAKVQSVLNEVEYIVGYKTYIDLIRPFLTHQQIVATGMRQEIDRCREAIRIAAEGHRVAVVSSGDAGVYGMAGIIIECLEQENLLDLPLEIIPGVTAASAAASMLGAPLMHDFAVVSLSDLLTPWEVIEKRVRLAAEGDFIFALYNPKSKGRPQHIETVQEIILRYRRPETPVGLVREALRGEESSVEITTLGDFTNHPIDMLTTVIIGNSQTRIVGPYMVTPRGYKL